MSGWQYIDYNKVRWKPENDHQAKTANGSFEPKETVVFATVHPRFS